MNSKIKEAYETVGSDRIFFGTDAPFHHPTIEMQKEITSGLTEKEIEDVFYNNLQKFMAQYEKWYYKKRKISKTHLLRKCQP